MIGRALFLAGTAGLALAACAGRPAAVEVRARPAPVSPEPRALPLRIAEAHVQLALGNVALASESYRKALRDDPESIAALIGLASAYDLMGRHDLARRYYELALALAPDSVELLGALAASLERQGKPAEARAVREEIAARQAKPATSPTKPPATPALPSDIAAAPEINGPRLARVSPQEVVLVTGVEAEAQAK